MLSTQTLAKSSKESLLDKAMDKVEEKISEIERCLQRCNFYYVSEVGNAPAKLLKISVRKNDKPFLKELTLMKHITLAMIN